MLLNEIKPKNKTVSSALLHLLAMAFMLCDHLWATFFTNLDILTCIGRIAYPIFAFMIVEGFFHTRSFKKYMLRLLTFALISEIPFDLFYAGTAFYPFHQNVLWTFLIALLLIKWLEFVKQSGSKWKYAAAGAGALIIGAVTGTVTMVDYYGAGVLVVLMFYFLRRRTWLNLILQLLFMYYVFVEMIGGYYYPITVFGHYFELQQEALAILALIPIWLYNGNKGFGGKGFKYFCYGFYPGHLLLLAAARELL